MERIIFRMLARKMHLEKEEGLEQRIAPRDGIGKENAQLREEIEI